MPSVPGNTAHPPPFQTPPNPNIPNGPNRAGVINGNEGNAAAGPSSGQITHQPSPAVVSSEPHSAPHILHRRFIGPIPENIEHSAETEAKRKRLSKLRKHALKKLRGDGEDNMGLTSVEERDKRRRFVTWSRKRRKAGEGDNLTDEESQDSEAEVRDGYKGKGKHKGKGKGKDVQRRKDVWVGESFDIGREFKSGSGHSTPSAGPSDGVHTPLSGEEDHSDATADGEDGLSMRDGALDSNGGSSMVNAPGGVAPPKRPHASRDTTQETFVTARTQFSDPKIDARSVKHPNLGKGVDQLGIPNGSVRPGASHESLPSHLELATKRQSGSSSVQPLMGSIASNRQSPGSEVKQLNLASHLDATPSASTSNLRKKIKSAMRKTSKGNSRPASEMPAGSSGLNEVQGVNVYHALPGAPNEDAASRVGARDGHNKSKSVQFPVDHVQYITTPTSSIDAQPRKGDKDPVDPAKVLSRAGDAAEGTSAGAVEEAMGEIGDEDEEEEEEAFLPGQVIMRGEYSYIHLLEFSADLCRPNACKGRIPPRWGTIEIRRGQPGMSARRTAAKRDC